jgi:uncharacterized protein YjbJ (UPF0337 family)
VTMGDITKRAKAKATEVKGKVKTKVGKATGNRRMQAEGVLDQAKGKTRKAVAKTQRVLKKATKAR